MSCLYSYFFCAQSRFGFVGSGTKSGQFVIEDYTGVIRLHSGAIDLDRDKYELNVTAVDDGSCCEGGHLSVHTSTAVVVVCQNSTAENYLYIVV